MTHISMNQRKLVSSSVVTGPVLRAVPPRRSTAPVMERRFRQQDPSKRIFDDLSGVNGAGAAEGCTYRALMGDLHTNTQRQSAEVPVEADCVPVAWDVRHG